MKDERLLISEQEEEGWLNALTKSETHYMHGNGTGLCNCCWNVYRQFLLMISLGL